jgi:hypothetical protein
MNCSAARAKPTLRRTRSRASPKLLPPRKRFHEKHALIAYLASRLGGIDRTKTVYEPTAGNGMLLIDTDPDKVITNEIDLARRVTLAQTFLNTTGYDATEVYSAWPSRCRRSQSAVW